MCGICAFIYLRKDTTSTLFKSSDDSTFQELSGWLKRRGPNHFQDTTCCFQNAVDMHFSASVLHLRGKNPAWQPITDEAGNVLLWNGEIFGGFELETSVSDTEVLSKELFKSTTEIEVLSVISTIKGPFAFIFYQNTGHLWFGRDLFGRRSLLWNFDDSCFSLCSVASKQKKCKEVPTLGLFSIDLHQSYIKQRFELCLYPWSTGPSGLPLEHKITEEISDNLTIHINSSSLECPILTPLNKTLPTDEVLEYNILSQNGHECSASELKPSDSELKPFLSENHSNFELKLSNLELLYRLSEISVLKDTAKAFEDILSEAVKRRVNNHSNLCKKCYSTREGKSPEKSSCEHASVGVLFSGGLDSIVIACLADRHLLKSQPIDLINVAFASNSSLKGSVSHYGHQAFETPDRVTGRKGVDALHVVCPHRNWNFVEVNVTEEDLVNQRRDVISHLLKPSCTVLDESIGCALWFAANGSGTVNSCEGPRSYTSCARVLLVGMGADEQLGGYARHRAKFNVSGWPGLIEELSLELDRIGSRNLGRDDRIIADNGVESRYPFLDENVVSFLNNLPVFLKMDLNHPRGVGEKLLLRIMALKLGLTEAAELPKRAIQFGSRIAKIENSKEKGSDVCERLKAL
ncbi:hypothetical protein JTE90_012188 [Oedothorax gibbosus]|uniref:Glutamine amidotransferase type-2 domain-containing protein n=1 Tax=Oedothorax gibbosus TaxID=931172 RepID=A0AAV6VAN5_9ARAC|nr:hypothetical protein JTE90_012188 [Oedothorax gibbosus]